MPKHNINPERTALHEHIGKKDTTHGLAPEASSAIFLRLLRNNYPEIQTGVLTDGGPSVDLPDKIISAQGSLIRYIEGKYKEPAVLLLEEERVNPNIARTVELIDMMTAVTHFTPDEQKKIWLQMHSIAKTCPGIDWNKEHHSWSTNRIYNQLTGAEETVTASPAETLNLICAALLDKEHYLESSSGDEKDMLFRIEMLCTSLLRLEQRKELTHYETCSTGRQHELLLLLHKAYLDKPRGSEELKPLQFIIAVDIFLLESLSLYLDNHLKCLTTDMRAQVVLDWIQWQTSVIEAFESPIITFLKARQSESESWEADCLAYIAARCSDFGLHPGKCKISDIIHNIEYISVPVTENTLIPLITEILKAKPFAEKISVSSSASMNGLIAVSNLTLIRMQSAINTVAFWQSHANTIKDFYTALEAMKSLYHYRQVMVFIGEEEGAFNSARQALQAVLFSYYSDFHEAYRLPPEFSGIYATYLTKMQAFTQQSQVNCVENFFAHWSSTGDFNSPWLRLLALKTSSMDRHPLTLSDEEIIRWHRESVHFSPEDGLFSMDISPYQINRILLHALLISPRAWTETYMQALKLITEWLLKPTTNKAFSALQASYPSDSYFLKNLLLIVLLNQPSLTNGRVKEYLYTFHESVAGFRHIRYDSILLPSIQLLSPEDITDIFKALKDQLLAFINNRFDLMLFISNPIEQLNLECRELILTAVQRKLANWITTKEQLHNFLTLPESRLTIKHKQLMFRSVSERVRSEYGIYYSSASYATLFFSKVSAPPVPQNENDAFALAHPGMSR